jgi:hypothetical protein
VRRVLRAVNDELQYVKAFAALAVRSAVVGARNLTAPSPRPGQVQHLLALAPGGDWAGAAGAWAGGGVGEVRPTRREAPSRPVLYGATGRQVALARQATLIQ